jgi:PiT family inorganic phosphate transporter
MSDIAATVAGAPATAAKPKLDSRSHLGARLGFIALLLAGLGFVAVSINTDMSQVGEIINLGVFALLGLALLIALGFEFVNGFHDTANAVATVIYTHSLPPVVAVVWSGFWNFLGVLISTGAVAYGIITLLPVELILQVGSQAGYAMIFALLLAAIIWNLGTWYFGIPNSSSHALIGSIMGVGLANQLMAPSGQATSGVDWGQAQTVFSALLFSPIAGFVLSALLLLLMKLIIRSPQMYAEPKTSDPPPWWIRGLLILTCTGVSFAHGNSDGQKGMGLIMLILIGAAPTAYALNRTMADAATPAFVASAAKAEAVFAKQAAGAQVVTVDQARAQLGEALRTHKVGTPQVFEALSVVTADVAQQVQQYHSVQHVPAAATPNMRNDMYLAGDTLRLLTKSPPKSLDKGSVKALNDFKGKLQDGTRFIPTWVKIAVALALGLGTMVGWKRIVVTVGEKIGKTHLTYGQGAVAEVVAFGTIYTLANYGLPVSTTHILSSGVAGTMAANGSGLQWRTLLNIALAWITTLPAAIILAGGLYWLLRTVTGG